MDETTGFIQKPLLGKKFLEIQTLIRDETPFLLKKSWSYSCMEDWLGLSSTSNIWMCLLISLIITIILRPASHDRNAHDVLGIIIHTLYIPYALCTCALAKTFIQLAVFVIAISYTF